MSTLSNINQTTAAERVLPPGKLWRVGLDAHNRRQCDYRHFGDAGPRAVK
ncbi:MAG: hypothetical protein M3Q45_01420 [Chloroflexota bacterium]|nr:hypothetical protein [Chloroflexota bacterium]